MSLPDIDFIRVPGRTTALVGAAALAVVIAAATALFFWGQSEERRLGEQIKALEGRARSDATPVQTRTVAAWEHDAQVSMGEDWNGLYGQLEALALPGVRLISLQASVHPSAQRIEVDLDGWSRVAELDAELNRRAQTGGWKLQSVATSDGGLWPVRAIWLR